MSHDHDDSGPVRRDVLCAGGAAAFSYVVAALLAGAKPVRAQALRGRVPEVDRLAVRVVTDSYQLAIASNMRVGDIQVERFGMPPAGKSLLGEFGLDTSNLGVAMGFATCCSISASRPRLSTTIFACSESSLTASTR
jgi:hypothetical protein